MTFFSKIVGCLPTTHSTTPSVVIKDARLGFLKFFFTLCIISYVGIYSFLVKKGWAAEAIVSASGRGHFITPPAKPNCTEIGGKYGFGTDGCLPFITPDKEVPHCYPVKLAYNVSEYTKDEVQSHQLGRNIYHERVYVYVKPELGSGRGKRQCVNLDNSDLTVQMGDALFLTTWLDVSMDQKWGSWCPVCTCAKCTTKKNQPNIDLNMCIVNETAGIYRCEVDRAYGYLAPKPSLRTAYAPKLPETFTLQLEHSYTAQNMNRKEVSSNMLGFLAVSNEELCNSLDEANPEKDPYQPNTKYMGDKDNDLDFLMKHDDSTICLLNLNRTYACMVERNKELAKNIKLDASWYGHKTVCQEDHYLVSTLFLASWDKSNSYATPLLDSPNLSVNKTCLEEPASRAGNGVCPEDKSQTSTVLNNTVPMGGDISRLQVYTSYTYEPTPLPYVY